MFNKNLTRAQANVSLYFAKLVRNGFRELAGDMVLRMRTEKSSAERRDSVLCGLGGSSAAA